MANQEHLNKIKQGMDVWNSWRRQHPQVQADLSGANLSEVDLYGANLYRANLYKANLSGANLSGAILIDADLYNANLYNATLSKANLSGATLSDATLIDATLIDANLYDANLSGANLSGANLSGANLSDTKLIEANLIGTNLNRADLSRADLSEATLRGATLVEANLVEANLVEADLSKATLSKATLSKARLSDARLSDADLSDADLSGANLTRAILVGTNLTNTKLKDCSIYGISAWDIQLEGAEQINLTITQRDQPTITVDNLKIAQFIYLLLNNAEIRDVINTLTTKSVLILGRFTPERKAVLDALKEALRQHDYLPILFDFDQPDTRDITETVTTLARLARFIIADLTDAKSIPQELAFIVPHLPSIPVKPLLLSSQREYGMFEHFKKFPWVLPIHRYADLADLLTSLNKQIIEPAEQKAKELEKR